MQGGPIRFRSGAGSSSSGQSSGYGSSGSGPSACPMCGRVHQGPCHLPSGACFRSGQIGHFARECPNSGFQQMYPLGSSSSVAQPVLQAPQFQALAYPQQGGTQFVGQQGHGSGGRFRGRPGRGSMQPSTFQQAGRG